MKESVRVLRFATVGTLNALITALVIWVMMGLFSCNYIVSNVAAYTMAQINNFFWSKYWVFTSKGNQFKKEVPLFLIAFAFAYTAQFLFLLLLVECFELNKYFAQFLGLFVYGTVNFVMNKKVTFKDGLNK